MVGIVYKGRRRDRERGGVVQKHSIMREKRREERIERKERAERFYKSPRDTSNPVVARGLAESPPRTPLRLVSSPSSQPSYFPPFVNMVWPEFVSVVLCESQPISSFPVTHISSPKVSQAIGVHWSLEVGQKPSVLASHARYSMKCLGEANLFLVAGQ